MDYRGYGADQGVPGQYTITEIAADTLTLADELGWPTFSLVGHSMGGSAVQRVAVDAPARVERLVGISPVPASGYPFDDAGWALFEGAVDSADNRRSIIDYTTGNRLTATWLEQMVRYSLETSDRSAFAAYLHAWGRTDFHREVDGNPALADTPVHVIVGEHDPALNVDLMNETWLKWYPRAELETIANAGHYTMFDTPVWLASTIESFLRRSA